jgi:hypothetical protein
MKVQTFKTSWSIFDNNYSNITRTAKPATAVENAKLAGYREPRWWEFWRTKLKIETL